MTTPSAPVEPDDDMEFGNYDFTAKRQNLHAAEEIRPYNDPRISPLQAGYSPEPVQPQDLSSHATPSIMSRKWKQDYLRLANLVLRPAALLFSFLSFVIMAANNQNGRHMEFDDYEEYRYSISIVVIVFVYSAFQLSKAIYEFALGITLIPEIISSYVDLICDQLLAYLLISSSSAAATRTNTMPRDAKFRNMAAASVSMAFICFMVVAASTLLSAFHLHKRIVSW